MRAIALALALLAAREAHAQLPRLEPVLTIGCSTCDGPEAFGSVESLALGAGVIAVGDRDPPRLRVFDLAGRLRWTAGRDGDGPGELRLPIGLGVLPDGSVLVADARQLRLSTFDPGGAFVTSRRLASFPLALEVHPATGRALMTTTNFRQGAVVAVETDGTVDTVLDPLPYPELRFAWFAAPVIRADGGFAFGEGRETYRIQVHAADGTLERAIARDIPRTRRTPAELEALERRGSLLAGRRGSEGGRGAAGVDPLRTHFTALDALAWDDQDRLWVRTERGGPDGSLFDVFDRDGRLLGEVRLDVVVDRYRVGGGVLVGVVTAEDGTARIAVWRVR